MCCNVCAVNVGDLDSDGKKEVFIATINGDLYAYSIFHPSLQHLYPVKKKSEEKLLNITEIEGQASTAYSPIFTAITNLLLQLIELFDKFTASNEIEDPIAEIAKTNEFKDIDLSLKQLQQVKPQITQYFSKLMFC